MSILATAVSGHWKRGVEFKRGSLHDGFGGVDGFGGSAEHLATVLAVLAVLAVAGCDGYPLLNSTPPSVTKLTCP